MKKKLSNEEIKKRLDEAFEDMKWPGITKYEWTAEDGTKCRSWKINTRGMIINTGDGGMEMFLEAVKKQANDPNRSDQI